MLPKVNRADTKAVEKVFKEGKFINYPNLTFKFISTARPRPARISFIAPKNIAKRAVDRNALRRQGYRALKKYITKFPAGLIGVFVFKKSKNTILEIENDIEKVLNKL